MKVRAALVLVTILLCAASRAGAQDEGVPLLLARLERIVLASDAAGYFQVLAPSADRNRARDFAATELMPGANRVVLHERDRAPLQGATRGDGYSVMVDVFAEFGSRARIATWGIDVKGNRAGGAQGECT